MAEEKRIEYMCSFCGTKIWKKSGMGRPLPGKCPRRNGKLPHRWLVNRKY